MSAAPASKPRILCVDDEPMVLEGLRDVLRRSFDVRVASSGAEGLVMLKEQRRDVAVVISDMRMPEMPGSVFLREARRVAPLAVRMLLTGYSDSDAAIKAVNDGQIFRFLTKPCDRTELLQACSGAVWQHRMQKIERDLLEQTLQGSVKALTDVLAITSPAVFGQGSRLKSFVAGLAAETGWQDSWEIEVAALLAHTGAITLPEETADRLYSGAELSADEAAMVARVPAVTQQILGNIPRFEGVLQVLKHYERRFDSIEEDGRIPVGARMLRVSADFLALEREEIAPPLALDTMRGRAGVYDPELLEAFARRVGIGDRRSIIVEMTVDELREGMTLVTDARAVSGRMLIARGHPITPELIERLRNFPEGHVREPLRVTKPV
jgi:response regulator RpfG family c-di-GMP phosphodiesterase